VWRGVPPSSVGWIRDKNRAAFVRRYSYCGSLVKTSVRVLVREWSVYGLSLGCYQVS